MYIFIIVIFIIIIIIFSYFLVSKQLQLTPIDSSLNHYEFYEFKNKIALYSCNFGNYRNELEKGIDHFTCDGVFNLYFFTDNPSITSTRWNIIQVMKPEANSVMDENRLAAKQVKFLLHKVLRKYEIIIWVDSKYIFKNRVGIEFSKPLHDVKFILQNMEDNLLLHEKHSYRETVLEEMNEISKVANNRPNIENIEAMNRYYDKVRDMETSIPLIEAGYIIRRNVPIVNKLFEETYHELLKHKLKRDQIVYPIVVTRTNFPVEKIKLCL